MRRPEATSELEVKVRAFVEVCRQAKVSMNGILPLEGPRAADFFHLTEAEDYQSFFLEDIVAIASGIGLENESSYRNDWYKKFAFMAGFGEGDLEEAKVSEMEWPAEANFEMLKGRFKALFPGVMSMLEGIQPKLNERGSLDISDLQGQTRPLSLALRDEMVQNRLMIRKGCLLSLEEYGAIKFRGRLTETLEMMSAVCPGCRQTVHYNSDQVQHRLSRDETGYPENDFWIVCPPSEGCGGTIKVKRPLGFGFSLEEKKTASETKPPLFSPGKVVTPKPVVPEGEETTVVRSGPFIDETIRPKWLEKICYNCGETIKYAPKDVRSSSGRDWSASRDTSYSIDCPDPDCKCANPVPDPQHSTFPPPTGLVMSFPGPRREWMGEEILMERKSPKEKIPDGRSGPFIDRTKPLRMFQKMCQGCGKAIRYTRKDLTDFFGKKIESSSVNAYIRCPDQNCKNDNLVRSST